MTGQSVREGNRPDPERQRLARSIFEPSSLDEIAEAVVVATKDETRIYVEQIGSAYRWSLTDPGGMYPLLRITARFLQTDYHGLVIGFRAAADGVYVLANGRESDLDPDAWAVLDFEGVADVIEVEERIALALKPGRSRSRPS